MKSMLIDINDDRMGIKMMSSISIAPLNSTDYDGYNRLMEIINRYHYEALPDVFLPGPVPMLTQHEYGQLLQKDDHHLIGAYVGGELCGFVQARRLDLKPNSFVKTEAATHIDEVIVDPAYRRQGIARQLLDCAEAWARKQGSAYVSLSVMEFNESARDLYETCGYVTKSRSLRKRLPPK